MSALRWVQITVQRGQKFRHIRRRFGGEAECCASAWVGKSEAGGVQRLAWKVQQAVANRLGQGARGGRHAAEVERIADYRMASAGQMNTDLVGAPGGEAAFQQCDRGAPGSERAVVGKGRLAVAADHGHALAVALVAADVA